MSTDWEVRGEANNELIGHFMEVASRPDFADKVNRVHKIIFETFPGITMYEVCTVLSSVLVNGVMLSQKQNDSYEAKLTVLCSQAAFMLALLTAAMQEELDAGAKKNA